MTTEQTEALALPERYKEVLSDEGGPQEDRGGAAANCSPVSRMTPTQWHFSLPSSSSAANSRKRRSCSAESLKLVPTRSVPWINLGRLLQQTGQWGEAVEVYEHATNLFPDHPQIAATLGQLYQRANRFAEAETQYRTAIENGGRPALYVQLGMVLLRQERTDEAVEAFQTAISFNPKLAAAYGNLGNAEQKRGNMEAAAAAYERACELNPRTRSPSSAWAWRS